VTTYQDECIVSLVRDEIVKHCEQNIGTIEGCAKAIKDIIYLYGDSIFAEDEFEEFSNSCKSKDEDYVKNGNRLCSELYLNGNKGCDVYNCPRLKRNQEKYIKMIKGSAQRHIA